MGVETKIEWTDHTFNPWIGCTKVSAGCLRCYAEAQDKRWRGKDARWGPKAARTRTSETYWKQPARWDRDAKAAGVRRRVFCASLADVFDDHPSIEQAWRDDLWSIIGNTLHLDWLLLTKRPENILRNLPWTVSAKPWPNVWIGTTVENQEQAEIRIPLLLGVPSAIRFLSVEPQLGPVDLTFCGANRTTGRGLHWVICGGESGHGARPFNIAWARFLRAQCRAADVPFFCKQLGAIAMGTGADVAEVSKTSEAPIGPWRLNLKDRKGGDWMEWPIDLRVREFPEVRHG